MVVLARLPEQAIIDGFKGTVDFYMYKDTACARSWPHYYPRTPTAPERANQDAFAYINRVARDLPPYILDQFKRMAQSTPFTWKDLLVRSYIRGIPY